MSISQKQLAQELKLSPATISRCLKNDPGISLETRSLVIHHATKRGYKIKPFKEQSEEQDSPTNSPRIYIVMIQTDESESIYNGALVPLLGAMSVEAAQKGVSLVFHCVPKTARAAIDHPLNQPEIMRVGKANGVILIHDFDPDSAARLAQSLPVISINIPYPGAGIDCIEPDCFWGIVRNVRHLHELGHQKLAYVDFFYQSSVRAERLGGYQFAAGDHGDRQSSVRIIQPKANSIEQLEGLAKFIRDDGVTAVVCANDIIAFEVIRWLQAKGLRCPEDVSVTGFDNYPDVTGLPSLTSCDIASESVGRIAVNRMIEREKSPYIQPMRIVIDCGFHPGESTAPPTR